MASWRALLRGNPLPWLLERRDPAVRAAALERIEDRSTRDPDLRESKTRAMSSPPISTILKRQRADGAWGDDFYTPKYTSTHWELLLLVEFGVDGSDARVRRGARRMLEEFGNGLPAWLTHDHGVSPFSGKALRYPCAAGFGADARGEAILERLCPHPQNFEAPRFINRA